MKTSKNTKKLDANSSSDEQQIDEKEISKDDKEYNRIKSLCGLFSLNRDNLSDTMQKNLEKGLNDPDTVEKMIGYYVFEEKDVDKAGKLAVLIKDKNEKLNNILNRKRIETNKLSYIAHELEELKNDNINLIKRIVEEKQKNKSQVNANTLEKKQPATEVNIVKEKLKNSVASPTETKDKTQEKTDNTLPKKLQKGGNYKNLQAQDVDSKISDAAQRAGLTDKPLVSISKSKNTKPSNKQSEVVSNMYSPLMTHKTPLFKKILRPKSKVRDKKQLKDSIRNTPTQQQALVTSKPTPKVEQVKWEQADEISKRNIAKPNFSNIGFTSNTNDNELNVNNLDGWAIISDTKNQDEPIKQAQNSQTEINNRKRTCCMNADKKIAS